MRREITVRPEDVEADNGREGLTRVLMGRHGEGHWAHLLTVPPGYTSEAHFHDYDQFQVVIAGSVDMAGEVLGPGSVHYTDAKRPYGPFTAGPDGLTLMIIRPNAPNKGPRTPVRTVIEKVRAAQPPAARKGPCTMPSSAPPPDGGPLAGLRVLELPGPFGEYAGLLFAEHGADVILVEPPGGAPRRRLGPFVEDRPGVETSLSFAYFNTSKRSVVLDLASDEGRAAFLDLAADANIVLDGTGRVGNLDDLGIGYDVLAAVNPSLVVTVVTPFGADGPYAAYESTDLILMAMGGLLSLGGYADGIPVRAFGDQAWLAAGQFAAVGTMLAVLQAEAGGDGQLVDVSAQEAVVMAHENAVQFYDLERVVKRRNGGQARQAAVGVYRCKDGHVYLLAKGLGMFWDELVAWLENEGIEEASALHDAKWKDDAFNSSEQGKAEFLEIFERLSMNRTKAQLYEAAKRVRLPLCPINTPQDLVKSPQLAARNYFIEVEHAATGRMLRQPGAPFKLTGSPLRAPGPAPQLGEHIDEVLATATAGTP